jgi:hypothetical protein
MAAPPTIWSVQTINKITFLCHVSDELTMKMFVKLTSYFQEDLVLPSWHERPQHLGGLHQGSEVPQRHQGCQLSVGHQGGNFMQDSGSASLFLFFILSTFFLFYSARNRHQSLLECSGRLGTLWNFLDPFFPDPTLFLSGFPDQENFIILSFKFKV